MPIAQPFNTAHPSTVLMVPILAASIAKTAHGQTKWPKAGCREVDETPQKFIVKVFGTKKSWKAAGKYCQQKTLPQYSCTKGQLFTPRTEAELAVLEVAGLDGYWIGGRWNEYWGEDKAPAWDKYFWVGKQKRGPLYPTNKRVVTNWDGDGEPPSIWKEGGGLCVTLKAGSRKWVSADCNNLKPFYCEFCSTNTDIDRQNPVFLSVRNSAPEGDAQKCTVGGVSCATFFAILGAALLIAMVLAGAMKMIVTKQRGDGGSEEKKQQQQQQQQEESLL